MNDDTTLTIKGSELREASSEDTQLQAIGFGDSDDGNGLDNFRINIYSTETIDRLEQESVSRDEVLQENIDTVEYDYQQADLVLSQVVDKNNDDSLSRDNGLSLRISQEVNDRQDSFNFLRLELDQEITDRQDADTAINLRIDNLESDSNDGFDNLSQRISLETQNRITADAILQVNIDEEESARISADDSLGLRIDETNSNLDQETQDRIAADNALGIRIDDVESDLSNETQARIDGDLALGTRVDGVESDLAVETQERIDADLVLQSNIDDEEAARIAADEALASDVSDNASDIAVHATELLRLEADKENNIAYGDAGYMAVVNDTGNGFEFIPQPSYDFIQMRGTLSEYTDGTDPDIFAVVSADPLNTHLYKDIPPNIPTTTEEGVQLSPNGYTYIAQENFETEITDGGEAISITSGDFIIWTGVVWNHIPVEVGAGVDRLNNLSGVITLAGTDGITVTTNTSNNTITVNVDSTVARTDDLNDAIARISANEGEIVSILQSIVYIEGVLDDHEARITANESGISSLGARVTQNESDIETLYEDFDAHISNTTGNPHNVTYTQTGAAAAVHGHEWSEISSVPIYASRWPTYAEVTDKPSTYPPSAHTHEWIEITDSPEFANRWPTFDEVTGKPSTFPPSSHSHPWDQVTEKPAQATRWPTAAEVTAGEFGSDVTIPGAQVNGTVGSATTATNQSGGTVSATTGAFSGAVTIQEPEADNHPTTRAWVSQSIDSIDDDDHDWTGENHFGGLTTVPEPTGNNSAVPMDYVHGLIEEVRSELADAISGLRTELTDALTPEYGTGDLGNGQTGYYVRFPGGVMAQWGAIAVPGGGGDISSLQFTWPVPFSSASGVRCTTNASSSVPGTVTECTSSNHSATGATMNILRSNVTDTSVHFIALGRWQ
ncbi:conserved hypothetical protein [Vibrio chagasii]|nr:conserved hypothetical protein [Vibrio chagasii]CAH7396809.1 conserved hypothetical protein [Vibrio chagasii]